MGTAKEHLIGQIDISSISMATIFNVLTNVLIVTSVLVMIFLIGRLIFGGRGELEVAVRSMAAVAGFLIYVGSKAVGLSIPSFMLSAISTTNPFTIGFLSIVVPGAAGVVVAWFCLMNIRRAEELGSRLVVLLSTFIVALFGDVYVATLGTEVTSEQGIDLSLLPNLTFTVGISLYIIFRYLPSK